MEVVDQNPIMMSNQTAIQASEQNPMLFVQMKKAEKTFLKPLANCAKTLYNI